MWTPTVICPGGKLWDLRSKLSLGFHFHIYPRAKLAPAIKFSFIRRWTRWLIRKVSSSCLKSLGIGLRGNMIEYMVVRALRQPSIASPMYCARSWSSTIVRQRRGLDHKLSVLWAAFWRAVICSITRLDSLTRPRQVPAVQMKISTQRTRGKTKREGSPKTYTAVSHKQTRRYQSEKIRIPQNMRFSLLDSKLHLEGWTLVSPNHGTY
jgi:hypothetical protein